MKGPHIFKRFRPIAGVNAWYAAIILIAICTVVAPVWAQTLVLGSTTSTEQSGLFAHLLPAFKAATGIDVKVVAVGTGQALDMGRRGDADVLLVHDRQAEAQFVADGFGVQRFDVMYNDFVLVGPATDPAGVRGSDAVQALKKLAGAPTPFISRGDKSGTHAAELWLWKLAGVDDASTALGSRYRACGCGMGPALNMAAATQAYVLTDRGTWLGFKNRAELAVLVQGDVRLFNPYGVIRINPAKHPHVNAVDGQKWVDWLLSQPGQAAIAGYRIGGESLFFPNAAARAR